MKPDYPCSYNLKRVKEGHKKETASLCSRSLPAGFLFPLLSCVFLTSCAVSKNIRRGPAKELIVFADGGSGQEGALYVLGIADDTVLWYSCRPLACGNPPPAVGAVTSPESPDLLLLGDFVWDWTAEKTDAA